MAHFRGPSPGPGVLDPWPRALEGSPALYRAHIPVYRPCTGLPSPVQGLYRACTGLYTVYRACTGPVQGLYRAIYRIQGLYRAQDPYTGLRTRISSIGSSQIVVQQYWRTPDSVLLDYYLTTPYTGLILEDPHFSIAGLHFNYSQYCAVKSDPGSGPNLVTPRTPK